MKKVTVKWLTQKGACVSLSEKKEAEKIGDVFKILNKLIKHNRLDDANWLLSRCMNRKQCVEYAVFAAERVIDIYKKEYPISSQSIEAIEAAKKYANKQSVKNKKAALVAYDAATTIYNAANSKAVVTATACAAYAAYAAVDIYAAHTTAHAVHIAFCAIDSSGYTLTLKLKIIKNGIKILKRG